VDSKLEQLLDESLELFGAASENLKKPQAFQNLTRLLDEQTRQTDKGAVPMENKEISPDSLQNPSEPDATFRMKANKVHTGYVLNVVEARDNEKEMSMIIYQEEQQNETSDVELDQNTLDAELKGVKDIVNDGAYYSLDTVKKAKELKIEMIFSALNGRKVEDGCFGVNEFVIGSTIPYLVKEQVKFNALRFTEKKLQIDIYRSKLGDERYEDLPISEWV